MFTRASVHWAERIVATSSSSALEWLRAHLASGYARSRRATIFVARVRSSAGDSRRRLRCGTRAARLNVLRSEEHTSELQSRLHLVCRLLLEKKNRITI